MVESLSNGLRCRHFVGIRCEKLEKFSNNYFVPIIMGVFWQTLGTAESKDEHKELGYDFFTKWAEYRRKGEGWSKESS